MSRTEWLQLPCLQGPFLRKSVGSDTNESQETGFTIVRASGRLQCARYWKVSRNRRSGLLCTSASQLTMAFLQLAGQVNAELFCEGSECPLLLQATGAWKGEEGLHEHRIKIRPSPAEYRQESGPGSGAFGRLIQQLGHTCLKLVTLALYPPCLGHSWLLLHSPVLNLSCMFFYRFTLVVLKLQQLLNKKSNIFWRPCLCFDSILIFD